MHPSAPAICPRFRFIGAGLGVVVLQELAAPDGLGDGVGGLARELADDERPYIHGHEAPYRGHAEQQQGRHQKE